MHLDFGSKKRKKYDTSGKKEEVQDSFFPISFCTAHKQVPGE